MLNFDRSITFCFGVSSNLWQQNNPTTAEILRIYFLGTIGRRKYLSKISAVVFFSCDKFEETPKQKVIDLSKFIKIYFRYANKIYHTVHTFHQTSVELSFFCSTVKSFLTMATISTLYPSMALLKNALKIRLSKDTKFQRLAKYFL